MESARKIVVAMVIGFALGWVAFAVTHTAKEPDAPVPAASPVHPGGSELLRLKQERDAALAEVRILHTRLAASSGSGEGSGDASGATGASEVEGEDSDQPSRFEELRDTLQLITGDTDPIRILNAATNSADPAVRALGLELELEMLVPPTDVDRAVELLRRGQLDERTLVAARYLGGVDGLDPDLVPGIYFDLEFPRSWGAAAAQCIRGNSELLEDWGVSLVARLQEQSPPVGEIGRALSAIRLFPRPLAEIEDALLIASAEHSEAQIRRHALPALQAFGSEATRSRLDAMMQDPTDPELQAAAIRAHAGVGF